MKLKKNKGYVGIDITVSVIILLIVVPTIAGMIYNISRSNNQIKRTTQAANIITNVMENAKVITFANESTYLEAVYENIYDIYNGSGNIVEPEVKNSGTETTTTWTDNGTTYNDVKTRTMTIKIDDVLYKLQIGIQDNHDVDTEIPENTKKIIRTAVIYKIGGEQKTINLNTYLVLI